MWMEGCQGKPRIPTIHKRVCPDAAISSRFFQSTRSSPRSKNKRPPENGGTDGRNLHDPEDHHH